MPRVLGDYAPEGSEAFEEIASRIDEQEIGGVIVSVGTPMDIAAKLNVLQRRSHLPLLVAADLETGAGFRMRRSCVPPRRNRSRGRLRISLPHGTGCHPGTLRSRMRWVGLLRKRHLQLGFTFRSRLSWTSTTTLRTPLSTPGRWARTQSWLRRWGSCLVQGIQDHGALATGKHFPGHGDTDTDSHLALPVIRVGRDRMDAVELVPFRRAIEAGMGALMTAHIALPEVTESPDLPATLSRNVLTGLLREDMGFEGLLFTDAMNMSAIDRLFSRPEAAVRAVEAGADVILMPPDPEAAIDGVMVAVQGGRILESRIDDSARRILRAKAEMGLQRERTVNLEAIHQRVGIESHVAVAQEIADRSITILRNERSLVPLAGTRTASVLSIAYRGRSDLMAGRAFDERLRETYPRLRTVSVGSETRLEEYGRLEQQAQGMDLVVVSLHINAVSTEERVAGTPELMDFIQAISESGRPNVVVSFGNPYLLSEFPDVQSYVLAWGGSEVSEHAAAKALVGEIEIAGRTPTRIPPSFEIGAGLDLVARPIPFRRSLGRLPMSRAAGLRGLAAFACLATALSGCAPLPPGSSRRHCSAGRARNELRAVPRIAARRARESMDRRYSRGPLASGSRRSARVPVDLWSVRCRGRPGTSRSPGVGRVLWNRGSRDLDRDAALVRCEAERAARAGQTAPSGDLRF